ncbi:hypothetical protein JCM19236_1323 [Vibrio sp. JCM 19236]|nr:hypothetical protein JCM19236_1323 [Vibrio sp. JCM 19236]
MATFLIQLVVGSLGALLFWAFIELKSMPGNIVDFGVLGIAVIDSIILTILISGALTCLATVVVLFRQYFD